MSVLVIIIVLAVIVIGYFISTQRSLGMPRMSQRPSSRPYRPVGATSPVPLLLARLLPSTSRATCSDKSLDITQHILVHLNRRLWHNHKIKVIKINLFMKIIYSFLDKLYYFVEIDILL